MTDAAHTTAAQGFILALDQGTTSSRALVFDAAGEDAPHDDAFITAVLTDLAA